MVQAGSIHGTSVEWSGQLVARDGGAKVIIKKPTFVGCSESLEEELTGYTQMLVDSIESARELVVCFFFE